MHLVAHDLDGRPPPRDRTSSAPAASGARPTRSSRRCGGLCRRSRRRAPGRAPRPRAARAPGPRRARRLARGRSCAALASWPSRCERTRSSPPRAPTHPREPASRPGRRTGAERDRRIRHEAPRNRPRRPRRPRCRRMRRQHLDHARTTEPIEHPTGTDQLVLRVETGGGFTAPEFQLRLIPRVQPVRRRHDHHARAADRDLSSARLALRADAAGVRRRRAGDPAGRDRRRRRHRPRHDRHGKHDGGGRHRPRRSRSPSTGRRTPSASTPWACSTGTAPRAWRRRNVTRAPPCRRS